MAIAIVLNMSPKLHEAMLFLIPLHSDTAQSWPPPLSNRCGLLRNRDGIHPDMPDRCAGGRGGERKGGMCARYLSFIRRETDPERDE